MNIQKFTQKSVEAIQNAQSLAEEHGNQQLQQEHVLLSLLTQRDGLIPELIRKCNASPEMLISRLTRSVEGFPKVGGDARNLFMSRELEQALTEAENQSERMGDEYVSVEHIVLGIIRKPAASIRELIRQSGISEESLLAAISNIRGSQRVTTDNPEGTYEALKKIWPGPGGNGSQPKTGSGDRER